MENGLSAVDFRVKISASQEKEREYMEKGLVFGLSIGELLTIYDLDSQSWKMSECLFTGDLAKYSEALPKSGMMRNGKIYEQATWARRTEGSESGLLPTPDCSDRRSMKSKQQGLSNVVKMLPTPKSQDSRASLVDRGKCNLGEEIQDALESKQTGLRLQARFVEKMMGYPAGWTDLNV